jgi:hypothetical protein
MRDSTTEKLRSVEKVYPHKSGEDQLLPATFDFFMRETTNFLGEPSGEFCEMSRRVNGVEGERGVTEPQAAGRLTLVVVGTW